MSHYALTHLTYILLVVPAFVIALVAQIHVKSSYRKYGKINNSRNMTGAQAAMQVLSYYGITNVNIVQIPGTLSDNYNPKTNTISLSNDIYYGTSIAAVGVACHEAGHAAQHAEGYLPIKIRNAIIPVCNIGSYLGIPLALLGYFFSFGPLIYIGLGLYAFIALFQLATLPVEINASRRAIKVIDETGMLYGKEEIGKAKKMLTAAAMTYVAALVSTLANLLRYVIIFTSRSRRD